MRAALVTEFGPPSVLRVGTTDLPPPGVDDVKVRVEAAGVNFPDVMVVSGTYQNLPDRPFVPGKELVGTVTALGDRVSGVSEGDRVAAQVEHGAWAEEVVVEADRVALLPPGVDPLAAAGLGLVSLTAWYALVRRAALHPGETVLVTGAGGGVGAATVQLARTRGARVVAVARDRRRADLALAQGADHALVAGDDLRDRVRELTGGRGADVVVECVGGDVLAQCLRATAWEGRIVLVGFASGEVPHLKPGHLLVKNIAVLGLQVSDYRDREPVAFREALAELLELHRNGALDLAVEQVLPLDRAAEALELVWRGGLTGRVVLDCRPAADPSSPEGVDP